jgi:hypothetical protein
VPVVTSLEGVDRPWALATLAQAAEKRAPASFKPHARDPAWSFPEAISQAPRPGLIASATPAPHAILARWPRRFTSMVLDPAADRPGSHGVPAVTRLPRLSVATDGGRWQSASVRGGKRVARRRRLADPRRRPTGANLAVALVLFLLP